MKTEVINSYNQEELLEIALNAIFPSTESIDRDILQEITHFLETNEQSVKPEDAEIVRGEIRKALIHFKNRPYLYRTRNRVKELLKKDENWRRFVISPSLFTEEMKKAGLSDEEIRMLRMSLATAEKTYKLLTSIPSPKEVLYSY